MKVENEPSLATHNPPRKSYNPFESDDEDTDGFVKSYVNTYDIKSFEKNADPLAFHLDNGDISWEEAILGHSPTSNPAINGEEGLVRKDTELFADKTVTKCELPELMICYKENSYHPVKDIGIDEGMPVHDKLWVKSKDYQGSENLSSQQVLNGEINDDTDIGNKNRASPYIDELKFRSESNVEKDLMKGSGLISQDIEGQHSANPFGTDCSIKIDELKHDLSEEESGPDIQGAGDKLKLGVPVYVTSDHHQLRRTDEINYVEVVRKGNEDIKEEHVIDDVPLEYVKESSTKPSIMNSTEAVIDCSESQKEEATSPKSLELPVRQESAGSDDVANALCFSSKVESENIVLDLISSSTCSGKEEEKATQQNNGDSKPPKPQTMSRHEDEAIGMDKWAHGEISFSSAMPPPVLITDMGANPRFGSISLRSESSTGSTRSFAFPVLQTEWNSSPVRMVKADQQHQQKHRRWVHSLICCKF